MLVGELHVGNSVADTDRVLSFFLGHESFDDYSSLLIVSITHKPPWALNIDVSWDQQMGRREGGIETV